VSSSCGLGVYYDVNSAIPYKPIIEEAIAQATHKPEKVIMFQRDPIHCQLNGPRFVSWDHDDAFDAVHIAAAEAGLPLFVDDEELAKAPKFDGTFGPVGQAAINAGIPVFLPY